MKKKDTLSAPNVPKMYGKGPVRYAYLEGDAALAVGVDFRLARPPATNFYADRVSANNDDDLGMIKLSFGHYVTKLNKSEECIEIAVPQSAMAQFLNMAGGVENTVVEQLKKDQKSPIERLVAPDAVVRAIFFANVIFAAAGMGDCSVDFYYMPIRDVHFARLHRTEIELEAIIRVIMPVPVVPYLFNRCRTFVKSPSSSSQVPRSSDRASAS